MSPERYRKVRELFEAAIDQATDSRIAFVQGACHDDNDLEREVLLLLDAHRRDGGLDLSETKALYPSAREWRLALDGERIGPYRIVRELGRGGMGVVYLAERADG